MSEKKKKKSLWGALTRRNPSSRHSMIETGSERSLDKSLEDESASRKTPGTVTTGSLDRLTTLNSKPPKSGFFYLKPKTPAFWKPLFPSSSQLNHTSKKNQLVQTDSPTQASTIDFGVQAVIVGRLSPTHTRDVQVQTCPAWDVGRPPTTTDGPQPANGYADPNKGRETVLCSSNGCIVGTSSSIGLFSDDRPLPNEIQSGSSTGLERKGIDQCESSVSSPLRSTSWDNNLVSNNLKGDYLITNASGIEPHLEQSPKSVASGIYTPHEITDDLKDPVLDLPPEMEDLLRYPQHVDVCVMNKTVSNPFSSVTEDFAQLNRDLKYFEDFSENIPQETTRTWNYSTTETTIDPAFDILREPVVDSHPKISVPDESCERDFVDNNQFPQEKDLENEPELIRASGKRPESVSESIKSINETENEFSVHSRPSSISCIDKDSLKNESTSDFNVAGSSWDFDSCENLEQLENEIIRSLYSPVPIELSTEDIKMSRPVISDLTNSIELHKASLITDDASPVADTNPVHVCVVDEPIEDPDDVSQDQKMDEIPVKGDISNRLYFTLENITEESNTDEGSVSPYRCHSRNENSETEAGHGKFSAEERAQTYLDRVGVDADKSKDCQDGTREQGVAANFPPTNETSELVIELPPRKAKIFVNVLELGNLKSSSPAETSPKDVDVAAVQDSAAISQTNENQNSSSSDTENSSADTVESAGTNLSKLNKSESSKTEHSQHISFSSVGSFDSDEESDSPETDESYVVSRSHIVLKSAQNPPSESKMTTNPQVESPHIQLEATPPPPPPPMPSSEDLCKASKANVNTTSGSPEPSAKRGNNNNNNNHPVSLGNKKSAVMLELEQKFLTRKKEANDLEHITKKIAMEVNKGATNTETKAPSYTNNIPSTIYDSAKFSSPKGYQKQNGFQNGSSESHRTGMYSPTSPSKSPVGDMNDGSLESKFSAQTVITDQPPPRGAVLVDSKVTVEGDKIHTDRYYALPVKEILKEKTTTTKFIAAPEKYEGIGPTEEGIPLALRQSVKKENMSDWYKTMYKTLHKIDNEGDSYVIGYTSDPELKKEEKYLPSRYDLKNENPGDRSILTNGPTSPTYPASAKSSVKIYSVKPGSIENYEPGHSSVVNEKNYISKRNLPDMNVPKVSYEIKDGYESETSFLKKQNHQNGITPENQKIWYRQVQNGGDVPPRGLGKLAPEKPKDPVVGPPPLPPQPLYSNQPLQYQKASRPETLPPEYANNADNSLFTQNNEAYAQHMRQIIQSEMQQRSYRVSSPQSTKTFRKTPEKKVLARVLFNFRAETPREVSLNKDDLIYIYRELDKNWYEGECDGLVGIFPISYVEVLPPEHTKKSEPTEGIAKVLYDFPAHTSVELQAKKGEEIRLIRKVDANWYEAKVRDRKGIIPCSYISVIQEPGSEGSFSSNQSMLLSPRSGKDFHSPVSSPSMSIKSVSSNVSPQPQNGYGTSRTKKASRLIEPSLYRALYRYSPQNADELELIEGDTLYVVEICDDGWYVGTSVRTGDVGIVPGNYLEKV